MADLGKTYEFIYRAHLAEAALDRAGRKQTDRLGVVDDEIAATLSIYALSDDLVVPARRMAMVYIAIAAFENSARDLITRALIDARGDDWWDEAVSAKVQGRAKRLQEEEEKHRFHKQRGDAPITYTTLPDLENIIKNNWEAFEAFFPSQEWVASTFDAVERARNVIMHSGTLDPEDIERVGINLRDWIKQVGA